MRIRLSLITFLSVALLGACAPQPTMNGPGDGEFMPVMQPSSDPRTEAEDDARSELMYQLMVGEIAGQLGRLDMAVEHYLAAARNSSDPAVAERATRISIFANQPQQGLEAAQRWVELAPGHLEARQVAAALLVNEGRVEESVEQLRQVVEGAPSGDTVTFGGIGNLLARAQNSEAALSAMRGLAERFSDRAAAHMALAQLALQKGSGEVAEQAAARALELNPGLQEARILQAQAMAAQGDIDGALERLREAVAAHPAHRQLGLAYGRLLIRAREFAEARQEFERLIAVRPDDADLLFTLGLLSIEVEQPDEARTYMERLLANGHRVHEANFYLGRIAEQDGRDEDALRHYRAVGDGDRFEEAQLRQALLMGRAGELDAALHMLREHRRDSDDPDWRTRLYLTESQVLRDAREYEQAMDVLNHGLREAPESNDLLYARALLAERMDRLDMLEADLRTILEREPDNASALNALGYTLADRTDRLDEAYEYITRAHKLRPDDAAILDSMGWVLYRMGRFDEAEDYLRRAYDRMYDPEIASNLAALLWAQGHRDEAWAVLDDALDKDPDFERLLRLRDRIGR
jgi:Flp pilus assembly protein TadD